MSGLRNKLEQQGGSTYSNLNGADPTLTNQRLSKLHFEYSINNNPHIEPKYVGFPKPSQLDLNGVNPLSANKDATTISINNSFRNGTYKNGAPDAGIGRI